MTAHTPDGLVQPPRYAACLPAFLGAVAALVIGLGGVVLWLAAHRIPALVDEEFEAAYRTWQATGPRDYEIETEVSGRQPAVYRSVVRDGKPVSLTRNGSPLPQQRTWRTWSVDGMFSTVRNDVRARRRQTEPVLQLRCAFDEKFRFPYRYSRVEYGQPTDVSWMVREFVVLSPSTDTAEP